MKLTTEDFITRAKEIHSNKYDYSKVDYKNNSTKVCIICPQHGEFWQTPKSHLKGCGCSKCSGNVKLNTEEFITRAKNIHGNKYDYSKVEYKGKDIKVCIICPIHGEFWQRPNDHVGLKQHNCPLCSMEKHRAEKTKTTKQFIEEAKAIHGDKYDYSQVEYINNFTKVNIICPTHGEFWQRPDKHLQGRGCHKCGNNIKRDKMALSTQEYIKRVTEVHNDFYDYSKINYVNANSDLCIICPQHGEFWQKARNHLYLKNGCPKCKQSTLEKEIFMLLENEKIEFIPQKKFEWLGKQSLDFYLPQYNVAIECQGEQHFKQIDHFGGYNKFLHTIQLDKIKKELCNKNNVKIIYYSNLGLNYPYEVCEDKNKLLEEIKK